RQEPDVPESLPCTVCEKILRRPQTRKRSADFAFARQRQSGLSGQTSAFRIPPKCSTPEFARTRGTSARKRANLPQKNWVDRWRPDTAAGTNTKGSGIGRCRLCP